MHMTICAILLFLYPDVFRGAISSSSVLRLMLFVRLMVQTVNLTESVSSNTEDEETSPQNASEVKHWDATDVNRSVSAPQYKVPAALDGRKVEKLNQNEQEERSNVWWPWANYKECLSVHRRRDETTTISSNSKQSKRISKERKPKRKHSQRIKNKKKEKTKGMKIKLLIKHDKQISTLHDSFNCVHSSKQGKGCKTIILAETEENVKELKEFRDLSDKKKSEKPNVNKSEIVGNVRNSTLNENGKQPQEDHVLHTIFYSSADEQVSQPTQNINLHILGDHLKSQRTGETEASNDIASISKKNFPENNHTNGVWNNRAQSRKYVPNVTAGNKIYTESNITKNVAAVFRISKNLNYSWSDYVTDHGERRVGDNPLNITNSTKFRYMKTETNRLQLSRVRNLENINYTLNEILITNMTSENKEGSKSGTTRSSLQTWKEYLQKLAKQNYPSDENECLVNNGDCQGFCINTPGSYTCHCPLGFRLDSTGKKCLDVNECVARNGHGLCQGNCVNTWGSYRCVCESLPGTVLAEDKHSCRDIDECFSSMDSLGCSHLCINTIGTAFCLCPEGYILGEDWKTCQDIDECKAAELYDVPCNHSCVNTVGSYYCL